MTIFTTFSKKLWDAYARFSVPTWAKAGLEVCVVNDGDMREIAELDFATRLPFSDRSLKLIRSLPPDRSENVRDGLKRFSWKSMAICDALESIEGDLVWLDADVRMLSCPPFEKLLPDGVSYLGRREFPKDYPFTETGFLSFKGLSRAARRALAELWREYYEAGKVQKFPYMIDCCAFDTARKVLTASGTIKANDLTPNLQGSTVFDQYFGDWMRHHKGQRKNALRTA